MKAGIFTVQSYDGGPEISFFNRQPYVRRAEIELMADKAYQKADDPTKAVARSVGMCILAARKKGLSDALGLPDRLTLASCEDFEERYYIEYGSGEIPTGFEVVDGNPTDSPEES